MVNRIVTSDKKPTEGRDKPLIKEIGIILTELEYCCLKVVVKRQIKDLREHLGESEGADIVNNIMIESLESTLAKMVVN